MANPTMKRSAKVESEVDAKNQALIQQLKELEYIWKCQERCRPRRPRSCSTASDHSLFQNSPRALMSSLQLQHRKPAFLRVKNCSNDAVEEILMDRRAAIMSGRFKGRQLFAESSSSLTHTHSGGEICSDGIHDREVMMKSSESCSFPEEKMVVEVEKRGANGRPKATASLCVVLIVLALVLFCISCNANNQHHFILVPT